jgi:oligopeptide transport system substrate-binding protein
LLDRFKDAENLKNYPGWENKDYQQLLNLASTAENRDELLGKAEAIFADEMPLTPIYHWRSPAIKSPRILQTATTPCGGVLFERFQVSR